MFDENKLFQTIKRDFNLESIIMEDMEKNAGVFEPYIHWEQVNTNFRTSDAESLTSMLDAFIGSEGLKTIHPKQKEKYEYLFSKIDNLNLSHLLDSNSVSTDYGSVMDINLINIFANIQNDVSFKVCEVGGGYGRLAKVFTDYYKNSVKYVLIDSVPVGIMFSYQYLTQLCPNSMIGFFYNNDPFDLDKYDIYIIPSWHFEKMNNTEYDIAINIESMQEMNYDEILRFMDIFNDCVKDEGIIYLSNSKQYVYQGHWPYPKNWDCIFRNNTPRSWTKKHPTEIFKKTIGSYEEKEILFDFFSDTEKLFEIGFDGNPTQYKSHIEELQSKIQTIHDKDQTISEQLQAIAAKDQTIHAYEQKIFQLQEIILKHNHFLHELYSSKSWKVVIVLRKISSILKKLLPD